MTADPDTQYPRYEEFWLPHHRMPYKPGETAKPCAIHESEALFDAWTPAAGNTTPSWQYVSTRNINCGRFGVAPGGWFDPGDHPNPEIYYILDGSIYLGNPDTGQNVELHAGDAAVIPAWSVHWGFNIETEEAMILWWVPGEMHTEDFKRKVQQNVLHEVGWYERRAVVHNGDHDRNEGFPSRLDLITKWPCAPVPHACDQRRLERSGWMPIVSGEDPHHMAILNFFYGDEQIQCGEISLPAGRTTAWEQTDSEKVVYVTAGSIVLNVEGSAEVYTGRVGSVLFIPANTRHRFINIATRPATGAFATAVVVR